MIRAFAFALAVVAATPATSPSSAPTGKTLPPLPPPVPASSRKPLPVPKKTTPKPAPSPPPKPSAHVPALPSVARVRVEVSTSGVFVTEDVNLPVGDWTSGDLALYVAFGAPGVPDALDAFVLPVADGALAPREGAQGEEVGVERAPRRPFHVEPLLGRDSMAGVIVHVPEATFRRATEPGRMATLRIRSTLPAPNPSDDGMREVLVRLGTFRGVPLTLGRVELVCRDGNVGLTRGEAWLAGPEADDHPLAIVFPQDGPPRAVVPSRPPAPVAPVLSVRHASDDLVVRFGFTDAPSPSAPKVLPVGTR